MKSPTRIKYLRSNGTWSEVYSVDNPPPQDVTSVNGKTGAVTLSANDVGARSKDWTPTFPVTSVQGKTGAVSFTTKTILA